MTTAGRRLAADQAGSTLIEYAFVASVLIVIMYGILEFGRALFLQSALQQAAQQAARCAAVDVNLCATDALVRSYAASHATTFLTIPSSAFTVATDATCGKRVNASYDFTFQIPFYGTTSMNLKATACVPK